MDKTLQIKGFTEVNRIRKIRKQTVEKTFDEIKARHTNKECKLLKINFAEFLV